MESEGGLELMLNDTILKSILFTRPCRNTNPIMKLHPELNKFLLFELDALTSYKKIYETDFESY